MSPTKYSLAWNEFESAAAKTFKDLLSDNNFTDVTLACEDDRQINAHKIILSSCSSFFERILLKNSQKNPIIYFKGICFKDLELIMRFIYLGEAEVGEENLQRFLDSAKELEIKGLDQMFATNEGIDQEIPKKSQEIVKGEASENLVETIVEEMPEENKGNNIEGDNEISTSDFASKLSKLVKAERSDKKSSTESQKMKSHGMSGFYCQECNKEFSGKGSLLNHTRYIHEGIVYSCDFCEYKAGQANNLKNHVIKKHTS